VKNNRFKYGYRQSASKLHKAVGEILRNSEVFGDFEVYQEYPVNRVNENYPDGRHHFDWVIPKLGIVVECHGEQHFRAVAWDGDVEKAELAFVEGQARDKAKKAAALDAGYLYVMVPYNKLNSLDIQYVLELIELAKLEQSQYTGSRFEKTDEKSYLENLKKESKKREKAARVQYLKSEAYREQLEKARKFRQKKYLEQKAFKERLKDE